MTNKKPYFDIENKILKHNKLINIISTATSYGKSTAFANWIWEKVISDEENLFAWIRRSETEIRNTVVPMFKDICLGEDIGKKVRVSLKGVFVDNIPRIFFIPLNLYYNFKSLTQINNHIKAIIWDEAIHCVHSKQFPNEHYNFTQLLDILTRNRKTPLYFLCNPYKKGIWFWEMFCREVVPDPEKEQVFIKENVLVFTAPLPTNRREKRGTTALFETEEMKKMSVAGTHKADEDDYITDELPKENKENYEALFSFIAAGKVFLTFYKKKNSKEYIIEPVEEPSNKLIAFSWRDYNKFSNSVLYPWNEFNENFASLLHSRALYFTNHSIRDYFLRRFRGFTNDPSTE